VSAIDEYVEDVRASEALREDVLRDVQKEATAGEVAAYAKGWLARDERSKMARRISPEASMAAWWRDVAQIGEGACWTRLLDGRVMPTSGENGPPRALSSGEAYAVGCPCDPGTLVHRAPCRMAAP
jgi:hypothetical protein